MGQINPVAATSIFPWAQGSLGDWLFSGLTQKPDGGWALSGAAPYTGQINADLSQTLFPALWGSYNPAGNAGTNFMQNYFNNGWMMGSELSTPIQNILAYGGPGGYGTDLMHTMAQYGGVGEPAKALSNAWQYGAPSQVGQPVGLISQYGGYGDWGQLLKERAQGGGQAAKYLIPFLTGRVTPWTAPKMGGM